jgi:hypothetical protein
MRPSESRSVSVLPGTSQESQHSRGVVLPPLTSQYPQWSRGGKLGIGLYPRPLSSVTENGLSFERNRLNGKVRITSSTKPFRCADRYKIRTVITDISFLHFLSRYKFIAFRMDTEQRKSSLCLTS